MGREITGGCQCGRVRYRVTVNDDGAYLCHCRMCRRATGGVAAALKAVRRADVRWEREPDRYRSSPIARRGFCAACGTPLTYEGDGSDGMDLTVGSFDDPSTFTPVEHSGAEAIIEVWLDTRALRRERTDEAPHLVKRWMEATGHVPE